MRYDIDRRHDPRRPLFRGPPDDLCEDDTHGFLLGGMAAGQTPLDIARAYRTAGDALVDKALDLRDLSHELIYPVVYVYRHTVELYLKLLVRPKGRSHRIADLVAPFEAVVADRFGERLPQWFRDRLAEFDGVDPSSTAFRFHGEAVGRGLPGGGEWWVEFGHLRRVVDALVTVFERVHFRDAAYPSQLA